jgi:prepilin-type processing-associated H-X9-DG protein
MSDAPDFQMAGARSGNHGGHGQNVLFSDGHVDFLANSTLPGSGDNLFLNFLGVPAAGRGPNDVVLVSGDRTPGVEYLTKP